MLRYRPLLFTAILLLALGQAAYAGEQVKITVCGAVFEGFDETEAIAAFNERYPDIVVEVVDTPSSNLQQALTTWLIAGSAPDVVVGWADHITNWMEQGFLLDLTPYIERYMTEEDISEYPPAQYAFLSLEGKQYGLPKYLGTVVNYYNRELLRQAGLPEPVKDNWTWETLRQTAKKLTIVDGDTIKQHGFSFPPVYDHMHYWIRQAGGWVQDPKNRNRVAIDSPEALQALNFLHEMVHEDGSVQVNWWPMTTTFGDGRAAMVYDGVWMLPAFSKTDVELGIIELAEGPMQRSTLVNNDGFAVTSTTKHPDAAFKFVKFLASPYANEQRVKSIGMAPATRSVADVWLEHAENLYNIDRRHLAAFMNSASHAEPAPRFTKQKLVSETLGTIYEGIIYRGELPIKVIDEHIPALNRALTE